MQRADQELDAVAAAGADSCARARLIFSARARQGGVYPFARGAWGGAGLAKNPKNQRPSFHARKKTAAKKFSAASRGGGQGGPAEKGVAEFGGRG